MTENTADVGNPTQVPKKRFCISSESEDENWMVKTAQFGTPTQADTENTSTTLSQLSTSTASVGKLNFIY